MTEPEGTGNGWERWRGEVTAKLNQLLDGQVIERETCGALRDEHDKLVTEHRETRGLAWRAIFIAVGAWTAIGVVTAWLWEHVTRLP
jgi:hypothetical protein